MTNKMKVGMDFVGYEYKEVVTTGQQASLMLDCYENFGWLPDERMPPIQSRGSVVLKLKRDRRIINKTELTRLQRNFEGGVEELAALEKAKTTPGLMAAITIGVLGTALMAGSTFAVTAETPHILLCIILAVPGFAGWILPLFAYRKIVSLKTRQLAPLIEAKYEEIYEICEKGSGLLHR